MKNNFTSFTVCNIAYLHKALALAESFNKYTSCKINIYLFDGRRELPDFSDIANIYWIEDLDIPNVNQLAFKYDITEFSTSLKPYLALKLLNEYKKVIFFGATNINEERKGGQYLKEALRLVANKGIKSVVLLTAGRKSSLIEFKNINFRCIHVGYLEGDSQLASAYQVADLFISPSMQDSGPMMVNESILCGTPVVAFNIGVALDLVITNETGYLAEVGEVNDLARGIVKIIGLSPIKLAIMKKKCRAVGMNKTSMRVISEKIISLISN